MLGTNEAVEPHSLIVAHRNIGFLRGIFFAFALASRVGLVKAQFLASGVMVDPKELDRISGLTNNQLEDEAKAVIERELPGAKQ